MSLHHDPARLDAAIRIDSLPPEGRTLHVETTAEQRAAIAEQLQITAVESLDADLEATRFRGGIRVTGNLRARIEQPCVVSLAPVHQDIAEPVDRIYLPEPAAERQPTPGAEIFVDLESDELPDTFDGRAVDLADMLVETLALAIDPYPHAPGARLETEGDPREAEDESPFAALKKLRTDGSDG